MRVGIVDADLLDHGTRHPNLALMKISGYLKYYFKRCGHRHAVELVLDYDSAESYDKLIVSKVFSFSKFPDDRLEKFGKARAGNKLEDYTRLAPKLVYGGTGFQYPDSRLPPNLPPSIERYKPDYSLYDKFVEKEIAAGKKASHYDDYKLYSIGFTTRGCFRKCSFCVNRHYDRVVQWSRVSEFLDESRPYIYLWDDNFLGLGLETRQHDRKFHIVEPWELILDELEKTGKPFQFRQGLDMRLMDNKIAKRLANVRYHGDFIFAFDHYSQHRLIEKNLAIWRRHTRRTTKFYVLCAYDSIDEKDIETVFKRIKILMGFGCLPYIMRYESYKKSVYSGLYVQIARWCNQPQFFKKKSFREFCFANQNYHRGKEDCAAMRALKFFLAHGGRNVQIADEYFDLKYESENRYPKTSKKRRGNNDRQNIQVLVD